MKYVYTIVEKSEDSNNIEDDFVVYGSFEKALSVCKDLLKQEFEYLESSYEDMELQEDFFINQEKEICEGSISDDDEVVYSVSVKKVLVIH